MYRKLCPAETLYVAQRSRAVLSCTVRGELDEQLLAEAFAAKVAEHPPLGARIAQDGTGYELRPLPESDVPALQVRPDGPEAFNEELNRPLTVGGPLARAVLLRGETDHTLVLVVDHTITDGHSAIALHHALWQTYTALADGGPREPAAGERPWPPPVTERMPSGDAQETERYLEQRAERARRFPVVSLPYEAAEPGRAEQGGAVDVQRVLLEPDETAALRDFARAAEVSVHGLVSAALLTSVRGGLGEDAEPRTLGCLSPVDLRSRVTPPLERELMVPAVASYLDVLPVAGDADPLTLARQVAGNLHAAIGRGDFLQEIRMLPQAVRNPALLATSVIVTNMGAVPGPPVPPGLDVVDMRLVPAREQYFPQAGRGPVMGCVTSFDNRLCVELPYSRECFGTEQIRGIRDRVHAALLALPASKAPDGAAHAV
ncbi:phthiocerol/phthiodiolone dimycocerosyl transferase family protein [Streptomyces sparsus]